jgi:hypothetical protein
MPNTKSIGIAYADQQLSMLTINAPITETASFTLAEDETFVIANGASANVTVTLPDVSVSAGRVVVIKNLSATYTVISSASNVKPRTSNTAGTAILAASAGAWAILVCDGTHWVVMAGN